MTWADLDLTDVVAQVAAAVWDQQKPPEIGWDKVNEITRHNAREAVLPFVVATHATLAPHVEQAIREARAEALREAAAYADEHCDYFEPAVSIDGGYGRGGYELGIGDWLRHRAGREAPDA